MIWAGLAVFLRKQPVRRQAVVFGVCCGLFIAAGANSTHRSPAIGTVALWAVVAAVLTGLAYYLGVRGGVRRAGQDADAVRSAWVNAAFAVAWLGGIVAAALALFGEAGFKVAAIAIVPIVLLAPLATDGIRAIFAHGKHEPRVRGD